MNPDYYKKNEKKLYKHELDRVQKMTDKELHTRYDKMGKQDKIQAFYEALTDEKRALELREKMEGNHGIHKKTVKKVSTGKGCTKAFRAFTGNTRPASVFVLRSDKAHDSAGVWHKMFMCYSANTVIMAEFENGIIDNTESFNYVEAREYWNKMIRKDINMYRDDSCIKGLPLGDIKL